MNKKFLSLFATVAALSALGIGCASGGPQKMTDAQQTDVRTEVTQAMHAWIGSWERLDFDGVMKAMADTPDFVFCDVDGKQYDRAAFRKSVTEMLANCSAEKVETKKERVYVLAPDAALYVWLGSVEFTQKDGSILRVDPYSASFLFKKFGQNWQIVTQHESAPPPQALKPAELEPKKK